MKTTLAMCQRVLCANVAMCLRVLCANVAMCLRVLCVGVLVCMYVPVARAQPHTTMMFPNAGQRGVATNASIVVRGTHPIVPPAITHAWPNEESAGWRAEEPTVLLVDAARVARMPRERWRRAAIGGSYTFDDPRTMRFTPSIPLRMGVTYRCIVQGIRLTANGGAVATAPHEFEFTTSAGIPTIAHATFDTNSVLRCNQSAFITFATIEENTLADAAARVRVAIQDVNTEQSMPLPHSVVLHPEKGAIEIRPHGQWPVQRIIAVDLPWGNVTGEPRNSKSWSMIARGAARLDVQAIAKDGRAIPSTIETYFEKQDQVLACGESAAFSTPQWFDDRWRFVRWESADIASVNNETSCAIDVTLPCNLLAERLHLKAIIERVDTMRIVVTLDSGGSVIVRDSANTFYSELFDTDTLMLTDALPQFTLTAMPSAGYTFSAWSAPNTAWNGAPGATMTITPQAFQGAVMVGANAPAQGFQVQVMPNFPMKITPLGFGETFRLRATIVDESPEPGFNAEDGVGFTTPSQFEEPTQVERTPCVRAERCWEIVSVNDASGGTGNEEFTPGTEEACKTAWLTDPENHITFSVRRRLIQLRVERVLIASEDQDDIVRGRQLHPESYVIVELQQGAEGAYRWTPLVSATCVAQDMMEFATYEVRCGDVVRFRIRGSALRGETWKFWANRQGYVMPGGSEVLSGEVRYTMVIDRDIAQFAGKDCVGNDVEKPEIRLRACFKQQFGIDALGLRVRVLNGANKASATFREIWLDPMVYYDQYEDEPIDGRQLEYIPLFGTPLRVRFTAPIDTRTVFAGGMKAKSYANIDVNNTLKPDLDFSVASFDDEHISFAPTDGSAVDIVEFRVCDPTTSPRKQALHFGYITLFCSTSLKSISGEPLQARFSFLLYAMEKPGYGLFLEKAKWTHDGDNDFVFANTAELYNVIYGAVLTPTKAEHADLAFQRLPDCREQQGVPPSECVYSYNEDDGYFYFSNHTLLFEPSWLGERDYIFSHIVSYDEDCKDENDCLVNKVYDLLDAVREKATTYAPTEAEKENGISWETLAPDLIDLGAQFIQALLPIDDQDEFIGQMTLLEGAASLWGAAESTWPYINRYHDNGEYVYKARLYPRRQTRF